MEETIAGAPDTMEEAVTVDPAFVFSKIEDWIIGLQTMLPNIVVASVLIAFFVIVGFVVSRGVRNWAAHGHRENLGDVLGSFLKWVIILLGVLLGLTIVIPSLRPGDLIAGLGIGSVAIGFAFKDILQNWLAGLLLLLGQPFRPGDQIIVNGYEGTVKRIETRATILTTYDGRDAIIPNSDVYSTAVTVNTAHETRRSDYDVGIGYGDDIVHAREVILKCFEGLETVEAKPAPEVLVWDLASSTVNLRVRWWTHSKRTDVVHVKAVLLERIKYALDEAGIDMAFPTQVVLFHNQTDEADGNRGRQREGWPAPAEGEPPKPARKVDKD
ncbi:mechanosensitive ion channel family protein [Falsirhodobacter sp. 20TX0035]|uniref:mechanosensitive ion channel family protein n=1 Tax=Falsirhodobacter sp. 20TX0035 TaxID=3022019 RepID=UPI002330E8FC|nr:mechanosensitive ion channel family protein [Falsirhodobacter sp. 20TX0035]MDB6454814.1 mechanosensitive ion channel family protein [Falsirhodobacter sp. 20TX0035]